jgi:hypothetical protein
MGATARRAFRGGAALMVVARCSGGFVSGNASAARRQRLALFRDMTSGFVSGNCGSHETASYSLSDSQWWSALRRRDRASEA